MVLERSESELLAACRSGERDGFRELFELYKDKVYSVALRFAGQPAEAMDIAQDTFLKLFSSLADFQGRSRLETWIYRLVVNRCLDHRRRSRRWIPLGEAFRSTLRSTSDSLADMLREERNGRVEDAVRRLAPDLRIVVVLRYTEGMAYDQIAEVLGCAPGTVASRLHRAHKLLERSLSNLSGKGGENA
ncbi:MAG: RNA polymerase sigma factor [Bryobacteraceae bacterium]